MNERWTGGSRRESDFVMIHIARIAVIGLAVCVVAFLGLAVYAYLARTIEPCGPHLSNPLWFAYIGFAGLVCSLCLLVYPSRTWPLWLRGYALLGVALLASGVVVWMEAGRRSEYLRPAEVKAICLTHVKFLALALSTYAVDNGAFPGPEQWQNAAALHLEVKNDLAELTTCPAARDSALAYAYNAALSGVMYSALDDPAHTVVLFESAAGRNVSTGGPGLLPAEPRHLGGDNYIFADGHFRWLLRKKLPDGTWAKEPARDGVIWEPVLKESEGEQTAAPDT